MPEPRTVIQHQDGHDLAIGQSCLWPSLLGRLYLLLQQPSCPVWLKGLANVIELADILHEPVEHGRFPTFEGADSQGGPEISQALSLTKNP